MCGEINILAMMRNVNLFTYFDSEANEGEVVGRLPALLEYQKAVREREREREGERRERERERENVSVIVE